MEHSLDNLASHLIVIRRPELPISSISWSKATPGWTMITDDLIADALVDRIGKLDKSLVAAVDLCAQRREAGVRALPPDRHAAEAGCHCR